MTALPSVAIVILNWNGQSFLEKFLPSVLATTYGNSRIIVADNDSTDTSVSFLMEKYPQIELIRLARNFGFAQGYNEALSQVEADYYVLLNSDVEVTPGWLEPLIHLLENRVEAAACQPKILSYHDRNSFEYAGASGGWIDIFGYPFARGRVFEVCEKDRGQYDTTEQLFWASGAAMVVKSQIFHQLKGLDGYFFAHMEEIDLCWRLQRAGFKVFGCPESVVFHVGGGTLPKGASRKTFLNYRNNLIMLAKNLPLREKWRIPFRMSLDQLSALVFLCKGDGGYFWAVVRAHLAFYYWIFRAKKNREGLAKRPFKSLTGVYPRSLVWKYFIQKKRKFSEIVSGQTKKDQ